MSPAAPTRTLEVDPWKIIETRLRPEFSKKHESIFALGNGYMGLRGTFEEGICFDGGGPWDSEHSCRGAYVNHVYEYHDYVYNWRRTAYPPRGHTILTIADYSRVLITVDGEEFRMDLGTVESYSRVLDMRRGILTRELDWTSPSGKMLHIKVEKFLSMAEPRIAAIRYEMAPLNFSGRVELLSQIEGDVRNHGMLQGKVLQVVGTGEQEGSAYLVHHAPRSAFDLAYAMVHCAGSGDPRTAASGTANTIEPERVTAKITLDAKQCEPCGFDKFVAVHAQQDKSREEPNPDASGRGDATPQEDRSHHRDTENTDRVRNAECGARSAELAHLAVEDALRVAKRGFDALLREHEAWWAGFWDDADLVIRGDDAAQQGVRFALFQLAQSCGRDGKTSCGANGLTGPAYNGHVFWDSEMYILPAFLYSRPEIARSLLGYRFHILDKARERARQMEHPGALFSWESISGEECGWIFEAATAQYHINNDIAYAIAKYHEATGDEEFIVNQGAEVVLETAKCMAHRGAFIPMRGGKFCINVVCGPDEYTPVVDNNLYTNMLAQYHLEYALSLVELLKTKCPGKWRELGSRLELTADELDLWKRAAESMYLPYNEELGINPQDDAFLYRDPVDIPTLQKRGYILLNMHPLNLWRTQCAKQADVVLLMLLMPHKFDADLKKRNYDFYEPRTIHDSSLSPSIHSILASEIGYHDQAYEYFTRTARMDLDDVKGNTAGGAHAACMGGSWMTIVYGFAGLRIIDGQIHLNPHLPEHWEGLEFKMRFGGTRIGVRVTHDGANVELLAGPALPVFAQGRAVSIQPPAENQQ